MSQMFRTEADVMLATAGNVDNVNSNVQSELGRVRGIVDSLRGSWTGTAQISFDNLMQRYDSSASRLQEALTAISDNLRSNSSNFADTEASTEQAFNQVGSQGLAL